MTDIEQKALALVNEIFAEMGGSPIDYASFVGAGDVVTLALCRAIEQHEAFRQEVSDIVLEYFDGGLPEDAVAFFHPFIIPAAKPDPLAQTLGDFDGTLWEPDDVSRFRAALEARGLEIREKGK